MKTIIKIVLVAFVLSLVPTTYVCAQTKIETPAERKARLEREAAEKKRQQQAMASRKAGDANRARLFRELEESMVFVKGGMFLMGAGSQKRSEEKPVHQVILSSYYICKYEVTQELWQTVMGSNPSQIKGAKRPVEQVSWKECHQFIKRLNQLTGKQYRLPTEAEWEFAARGGNRSKGYQYAGSDSIGDVAWYRGNSNKQTHDVGMKLANELGLYDMSGNVSEFCEDWYAPYDSVHQINPKGPVYKKGRSSDSVVTRGGCWFNRPFSDEWLSGGCEVWFRDRWASHFGYESIGFRLAEDRQNEEAKHRELEALERAANEQAVNEQAAKENAEKEQLEKERAARKLHARFYEGLAVYRGENGFWGFINEAGDIVIPCEWNEVSPFRDGLARVKHDQRYGYIDKTGKLVIPCTWKKAYAFSKEGLARVMDDNDRYGFINQAGEVVVPCTWWNAGAFSEGLAPVAESYHKWGYIDTTGKVVLPCIWGEAESFSEGLAAVESEYGGKWGFIDKTGKFVIPFGKLYDALGFKDGLAPVAVAKGGYYDKKWGLIDKTGKEVIKCKWSWIELPSEGLCVVKSGRKYGYVNEKGKLVIPCQWKNAYSFHNGVAEVEDENGNKHKIDKTGRIIE